MLSAVDGYRQTSSPLLKAKMDSAVAGLLATQSADGYIGNYAPDSHLQGWLVWGRKSCLLGLLAYHDLFPDQRVMRAIKSLADHLLTEVGPGKANIVKSGNFCGMGMNCCTANGPRGLLLIPHFAVMREKSGIVLNLFEALEAVTQTPSRKSLIIRQSSDYPASGLVQIRLQLKQKERFTVKIRIPAWSDSTRLTINDREALQPAAGAYHSIDRLWEDNDLICLTLDLRPRWQQQPADHHRHVAVMRGPLVLARDQRWDWGDVDEPAKPHQEQGDWVLHPITTLPGCWFSCTASCTLGDFQEMEFGRPRNLTLVDYASAGNTWSRELRFRVWWPLALNPMEP